MSRLKAVLDNALGQTTRINQEKKYAKTQNSEEGHEQLDEKTPPPPSPKPNDYHFDRTPKPASEGTTAKHVSQHLSHTLDSDELIKKLRVEASKDDKTLSVPPLQRSESSRARRRRARAQGMNINVAKANDVDNEAMSDDPQINHYATLIGSVPYEDATSAVLGSPWVIPGALREGEAAGMGVRLCDGSESVWRGERWVERRVGWTRRRSAVEKAAREIEGAWVERGGGKVGVWAVRTREGQGGKEMLGGEDEGMLVS
ncbi:hypothetical protein EJ03DRAFT_370516 [Teratosphaeria nubilosa]|uniref:Uncharacterized protein n=1 Tax=Teratosphaeria nubilosa TaxID=161662 RepID=A0A6G1LN85_9PEZI|nr:hypothetical protein EJ03DRAFT_370516 [Teratosphaeria nubilosa]